MRPPYSAHPEFSRLFMASGSSEEDELIAALPPGKAYIVESGVYVKEGPDFLIEDI